MIWLMVSITGPVGWMRWMRVPDAIFTTTTMGVDLRFSRMPGSSKRQRKERGRQSLAKKGRAAPHADLDEILLSDELRLQLGGCVCPISQRGINSPCALHGPRSEEAGSANLVLQRPKKGLDAADPKQLQPERELSKAEQRKLKQVQKKKERREEIGQASPMLRLPIHSSCRTPTSMPSCVNPSLALCGRS